MLFKHFLPMACCALASVACQVDEVEIPADELYTRQFIKDFGIPDPDQDWNLASVVTAVISPELASDASTVYVYDRMPGAEGCQLAARFSASTKNFQFDFAKANTRAFVQATAPDGTVIFSEYVPLRNRTLQIGSSSLSRADAETPATSIRLQPITKNEEWGKGIGLFCFNTFRSGISNSCNYPYWHDVKNYNTSTDNKTELLNTINLYGMHTGNLDSDYLQGKFKDSDDGRPCSDLAAIVGKKGVFHEGVVDSRCNLNRHSSELKPEEGVIYTSVGGEIELEYAYGAGIFDNSFGYFYYNEGASKEEIMDAPKFILMFDASPWNNTMREKSEGVYETFANIGGYAQGESTLTFTDGIDNFSGMRPSNDIEAYENDKADKTKNIRYKPSFHKLVYYELDADNKPIESSATYTFPAGMKIGFFILCQGHQKLARRGNVTNNYNDKTGCVSGDDFRFSIPWMNQLLGCYYESQNSHGATHYEQRPLDYGKGTIYNYTPHMSFVTYNWNGQTVMGVEDGQYHQNDHDMNDILFFVRGVNNDQHEFETDPKIQSWIIACEDLGGTYDFDFNDVVFGVSHVATDESTQQVSVTALAAGGTLKVKLCYNGTPLNNGKYWNLWFNNISNPHLIINAGPGGTDAGVGETFTMTLPEGEKFSISSDMFREGAEKPMGGFSLIVEGSNNNQSWVLPPTPGELAPQMILVHQSWMWPSEQIPIWEAYSGNDYTDIPGFQNWCNHHDYVDWADQYAHPSLVIPNTWTPPSSKSAN